MTGRYTDDERGHLLYLAAIVDSTAEALRAVALSEHRLSTTKYHRETLESVIAELDKMHHAEGE